jgi:type II secretory pathway pseudopilin PulG
MTGSGWKMSFLCEGNKQAACGRARDEEGFAIVVVLVALLMLSVLGAMSLLVMVSSLQGVVNLKPEERAFQVAEAALNVAHARIINDEVGNEAMNEEGSLLGGEYSIEIEPVSATEFVVISEGKYENNGNAYRRRIREEITYTGKQNFDVMRKYLLYAGNDINILFGDLIHAIWPVRIVGSIRAERDINITLINFISIGLTDFFSIGDTANRDHTIEAGRKLKVVNAIPVGFASNTRLNADVITGGEVDLFNLGIWTNLHVARDGAYRWNIYCSPGQPRTQNISWGSIYLGNVINSPGVSDVFVPEPDFEYYKAVAKEQGRYYDTSQVWSNRDLASFMPPGSSAVVVYVKGDITLRSFLWNRANVKATFVCEGNFRAENQWTFNANSKFQVIAKGNAVFDSGSFSIIGLGANDEFFFWAGNDVNMHMGFWSNIRLQVTAKNNINISGLNLFNTAKINYHAPDVDIGGFPIDVIVKDWRELPSEGP